VWWVTADTAESVQAGLAALTTRLQPELSMLPLEALAQRAVSWLAAHKDWLLVLDNANDPGDITPLLSPGMSGRVVVTSRLAEGWHYLNATVLRLDVLTETQAVELLARIAVRDRPAADLDGAAELVAELGCLPLAVEQAAAYLHQNHLSPRAYLQLLAEHPAVMYGQAARGADSERTIARIWQVTLDALTDTLLAGDVLRILAWYAPEPVPRTLLDPLAETPPLLHALGALAAYNLITLSPEAITVHRLVQTVARTPDPQDPHRRQDDIDTARTHATDLLNQALPADYEDPDGWPAWRTLLPHIDALTGNTPAATDTAPMARLLNETGLFLGDQGAIDQAIAYHQRAHNAYERVRGPDHPHTLTSRNNLAGAYESAGDLGRAIPVYEQTLADRERVLGPDHPSTRTVRANLDAISPK
jgi:tetratricopeptide (TPR) repeat protein